MRWIILKDFVKRRLLGREKYDLIWSLLKLAERTRAQFLWPNRKEVIVLGDSHCKVFDSPLLRKAYTSCWFWNIRVDGATVMGLTNEKSTTRAGMKFKWALGKSKAEYAVVLLGEVDLGHLIWLKADNKWERAVPIFSHLIESYQRFLEELSCRRVIVLSIPLPTIDDDFKFGEVAGQRNRVTVTKTLRTKATLEVNKLLKERCNKIGVSFVDLDGLSMSRGELKQSLLNQDKYDHHYNIPEYADLIARTMRIS